MASRGRRVRGATLLEIAVAVAILGVLGALVYPTIASSRDRNRVVSSIRILQDLNDRLERYDTLVSNQGTSCTGTSNCNRSRGRYPLVLRHLVDSITSADLSSCGISYTTDRTDPLTGWRNNGPFYTRDFTPGVGMRIPIGIVRDTLVRTPANTVGTNEAARAREWAMLQIRIDSARVWDVRELARLVDGYVDGTQGTIRWSATPTSDSILQPVFWSFPIGGC